MPAKVLMIGLDAADRAVVENLAESGRLPNIQRLRQRGVRGTLRALPALGDDAVWTSFATGVGPGWHGRFYHKRWDGTRLVPHRRDAVSIPPFWQQLSERGLA
ncbi:MAG: alkaline phosphatase family protein, partial [Terriglobales bacterium]